ncbi:MAG: LutC/YkgG family protein [Burkholderiales bacterium]
MSAIEQNAGAKERILARIRSAREAQESRRKIELQEIARHLDAHPRGPRLMIEDEAGMAGSMQARFLERARAMASTFEEVASMNQVPHAIAAYLIANGLPKEVVAWPEFSRLDWRAAEIDFASRPAAASDLIGVTGAFCAIAETGTLLLLSGSETPATTSMLPETHIAIVHADRIVATMEEAFMLVRGAHQQLPRAVYFVSGPSRTADIEQTIVLGAHGPYRLHILLVGRASHS